VTRGRNTSLITEAGPESAKLTSGKQKFKSSKYGSLHNVPLQNKNQS